MRIKDDNRKDPYYAWIRITGPGTITIFWTRPYWESERVYRKNKNDPYSSYNTFWGRQYGNFEKGHIYKVLLGDGFGSGSEGLYISLSNVPKFVDTWHGVIRIQKIIGEDYEG